MAVRAVRYASEAHLEDMADLIAHLMADPQAATLASDVEVAAAALQTQTEDWSDRRHTVEETQTKLENVEEDLRDVVRTARDAILADVRHRRRSPKFLTYFPRGLAAIVRASYTDELAAVQSLAERCAQDPSPRVRNQAGLLRAAAEQMQAAYERRADARVAETTSYGLLQVQKLQAIETCLRTGYRLAELYPHERDRVRSYFRLVHHRPRSKATMAEGAMSATVRGTAGTERGTAAPVAAAAAPLVAEVGAAAAMPMAASALRLVTANRVPAIGVSIAHAAQEHLLAVELRHPASGSLGPAERDGIDDGLVGGAGTDASEARSAA